MNILTLEDSYPTGSSQGTYSKGDKWAGQTITPVAGHTIKKVSLPLRRHATFTGTGTATVSIRATAAGLPTGANLCSGTHDLSSITTNIDYDNPEWYDFDLGAGTALTGGVTYAIILSHNASGSTDYLWWHIDVSSPTYTGGSTVSTSDAGSTWTATTGNDNLFKEYSVSNGFYFAASGEYYTPWFDAGTAVVNKLIKRVRSYARSITSTETVTIYYRTNRTITDLTNGWSTLDTLNTSSDNGEVTNNFGSGVGTLFGAIQFKIAFARGSTTTVSPDLQSLTSSYSKATKGNWMWTFTVKFDTSKPGSLATQQSNLDTALESEYHIPMIYRRDDTKETHYVKLYELGRSSQTGTEYGGEVTLQAIEM
jgi:hypothetical protein